jgi:hypothetical protein
LRQKATINKFFKKVQKMLSQSPGIYILLGSVLSAILSSVISGIMLLTNNYFNNKFQLKREEQQRIWQVEQEQQQRIWQEKSEQQKWYREKIYDCYRRANEILTKIIQEDFEIEVYQNNNFALSEVYYENNQLDPTLENKRTKLGNLTWEFYTELNLIEAGYPEKNSNEFKEKINRINECLKKVPISVGPIIAELMENDSRIK